MTTPVTRDSVMAQSIPGGWTERELEFQGHRWRIHLATEPDKFLDHYTEDPAAPAELRDPYWARLWPVSEQFADYLLRAELPSTEAPSTKSIFEIGCGLGLPGLALLARGQRVVFTDYVPLAVRSAVENAMRNGFAAEGRVVDWHHPPRESWPFVVGSDLVYDRNLHRPLLDFLWAVQPTGGQCWLADPGRSIGREFIATALSQGFEIILRDFQGNRAQPAPVGTFQVIEVHSLAVRQIETGHSLLKADRQP